MPRQFEPYPGELSATFAPDPDPPDIDVEAWVPGTHRLPPDLAVGEHVDWRDVNYLGDRINEVRDWITLGGDPTERYRYKQGDDHPTWDTGEHINPRDLGAVGDGIADDSGPIAAAFAQSDASGVPVFLPKGTYLTDTINYRGQSIIGVSAEQSIFKGKPGQDVLHLDPTLGQYTHGKGVWRQFQVLIDDSVDASATFTGRGGVGNAGFAVDFADGAARPYPLQMIGWRYEQVVFLGSGQITGGRNNACGIYTQFATIVISTIDALTFDALRYGWWDDTPRTNLSSAVIARDHLRIGTVFFRVCGSAWRLQNWAYGFCATVIMHNPTVRGLEFQGVAGNTRTVCIALTFDNVMIEAAGDVLAANPTTTGVLIRNLVSNGAATVPTWNGNESNIAQWTLAVVGNPATVLNLSGHRNQISLRPRGDSTATYGFDQINTTGHGNSVMIDAYTATFATALRRRENTSRDGRIGHARDSTSGLLGYLDPMFVGGDDLVINPRQLIPNGIVETTDYTYAPDATADFGVALHVLAATGTFNCRTTQLNGFNGFKVGKFLPPGKVRVYAKVKAATGGTQVWRIQTDPGGVVLGTTTATITTAYTVISWDVDLSAQAIDQGLTVFALALAGGGVGPLDVAWIMFRPWAKDWLVSGAMQGQVVDSGGQFFNVKSFNAKGDSTTNDVVAIQAAIDAAVAAGGGTVFLPGATYKVNTAIQLKVGVRLLGVGSSPGAGAITTILGTAGQNVIELPTTGSNVGFGVENLILSGGLNGIYVPANAAGYTTYVKLRDLHIVSPSQSCIEVLSRIEEWDLDKVSLYGGQYGFRYNGARPDKCTFTNVETRQQSLNGWSIAASEASQNLTWINLISHLPGQHAFVVGASVSNRNWVFINAYCEGTGQTGKSTRTTGSITTGTPTLTVASGTGLTNGDPIVVGGAGANGIDLFTTISSGGGTTTLTLAANAATTVTAAPVSNGSYDDFSFPAGCNTGDVTFVGGLIANEGTGGHVRYAIDARGAVAAITLIGTTNAQPVYDPTRVAQALSAGNVRQPANFLGSNLQYTSIAGPRQSNENIRTLLPSPPGRDTVLALRDSTDNTSGTYGNLEVRRNDANKTVFIQGNATTLDLRTRGRILEQGLIGWSTIVAGTTTPDVVQYSYHKTANSSATTITNFVNGVQPMTITIHCTDANTTIANNATIATNTGANKLLVNNRIYRFTLSGTTWIEDA
jgi:hypothetical protein